MTRVTFLALTLLAAPVLACRVYAQIELNVNWIARYDGQPTDQIYVGMNGAASNSQIQVEVSKCSGKPASEVTVVANYGAGTILSMPEDKTFMTCPPR